MFVGGKLNPELEDVYAEFEKETGVPCEVLAGIHFEEASAYFTDYGHPETRSAANKSLQRTKRVGLKPQC